MMSSSRVRRALAGTTIAALAALTLSACNGAPATDESSNEPVTLRFAWWGSDSRHALTQEVIDLFEEEHPNITIEPEYGEWGGYWDKLATQVAGGNAPDIVQFAETYLSTYAERGALLDLSGRDDIDVSDIDESVLATGQVGDSLYGVPTGVSSYAMLSNDTLAAQSGIGVDDDTTWTWDDLKDTSVAISDASEGAFWGMQSMGHDLSAVHVWAHQHGEEVWDKNGEVVISPETLASWWQYILDQQTAGGTPPASVTIEGMTGTEPPTLTNKVELGPWPANQIGMFAAGSGSEFSILELPSLESGENNGAYFAPTMFWTITSGSKHPAEAAEFVDFLTNNQEAAKLLGTDRGVPANLVSRENISGGLTGTDKTLSDFITKIGPKVEWAPAATPNGAADANNMLVRYTTEVLFERLTPQDAAEQYIAELQAAIDAAQ